MANKKAKKAKRVKQTLTKRQHMMRTAAKSAFVCILLFAAAFSFADARDDISSQLLKVPLGLELSGFRRGTSHAGPDPLHKSGTLLLLTDTLNMDLRLYRGGVPVAIYPLSAKAKAHMNRSKGAWERALLGLGDPGEGQTMSRPQQRFTVASQSALELLTDQTIAESTELNLLSHASQQPSVDLRLYQAFDLVSYDGGNHHGTQQATDDDNAIYIAALDDPGMGDLRGGFTVGRVELNFGASVTSIINNVRLESVFTISQSGLVMNSQTLQSLSGAPVDVFKDVPVQVSLGNMRATGGSVPGSSATLVGGENGASLGDVISVSGSDLIGLQNLQGVVINNPDGSFSAALHDVSQNSILGTVVSDASNQNIQQHIDVRIDAGNIGQAATQSFRSHISNTTNSFIHR